MEIIKELKKSFEKDFDEIFNKIEKDQNPAEFFAELLGFVARTEKGVYLTLALLDTENVEKLIDAKIKLLQDVKKTIKAEQN